MEECKCLLVSIGNIRGYDTLKYVLPDGSKVISPFSFYGVYRYLKNDENKVKVIILYPESLLNLDDLKMLAVKEDIIKDKIKKEIIEKFKEEIKNKEEIDEFVKMIEKSTEIVIYPSIGKYSIDGKIIEFSNDVDSITAYIGYSLFKILHPEINTSKIEFNVDITHGFNLNVMLILDAVRYLGVYNTISADIKEKAYTVNLFSSSPYIKGYTNENSIISTKSKYLVLDSLPNIPRDIKSIIENHCLNNNEEKKKFYMGLDKHKHNIKTLNSLINKIYQYYLLHKYRLPPILYYDIRKKFDEEVLNIMLEYFEFITSKLYLNEWRKVNDKKITYCIYLKKDILNLLIYYAYSIRLYKWYAEEYKDEEYLKENTLLKIIEHFKDHDKHTYEFLRHEYDKNNLKSIVNELHSKTKKDKRKDKREILKYLYTEYNKRKDVNGFVLLSDWIKIIDSFREGEPKYEKTYSKNVKISKDDFRNTLAHGGLNRKYTYIKYDIFNQNLDDIDINQILSSEDEMEIQYSIKINSTFINEIKKYSSKIEKQ